MDQGPLAICLRVAKAFRHDVMLSAIGPGTERNFSATWLYFIISLYLFIYLFILFYFFFFFLEQVVNYVINLKFHSVLFIVFRWE